jgi:hypothetical protein
MAAESIGAIYSTKIPGYADNADVQAAFKLYHYGSTDYNTANANTANLVNPSIAYTLNDLQSQITGLDPAGSVSKGTIDAKGDLLVGSANDTVDNLPVGSNNYVLVADSAQALGIKWAAPVVTLDNTATLTNKTLTSPTISGATFTGQQSGLSLSDSSIVFEGATADAFETSLVVIDPTADRTIYLPDSSGTLDLKDISFNSQSGTTYTFVLSDSGKMIKASNASAQTYSIPTNASVAFPIGTQIHLIQTGSAQITVQAVTSGTTTILSTATTQNTPKTRVQYASVTCIKSDTDEWYVIGDII